MNLIPSSNKNKKKKSNPKKKDQITSHQNKNHLTFPTRTLVEKKPTGNISGISMFEQKEKKLEPLLKISNPNQFQNEPQSEQSTENFESFEKTENFVSDFVSRYNFFCN